MIDHSVRDEERHLLAPTLLVPFERFGLIHGDLHQDKLLFDQGNVRAIDFDDCEWGHFVADLGTTLGELRARPDYKALRDGLLRGYSSVRTLTAEHERHLDAFHA